MRKLLLLPLWLLNIGVVHAEVLVSCNIGPGPTSHVEVLRENRIADTWLYSLRMNGQITPVFSEKDISRGSSVYVQCVGEKNHAIVLAGEFSANALQGFVLTYNPKKASLGRLNFADKLRPIAIFLNEKQTMAVVPTNGLGETGEKFRIYRASLEKIVSLNLKQRAFFRRRAVLKGWNCGKTTSVTRQRSQKKPLSLAACLMSKA